MAPAEKGPKAARSRLIIRHPPPSLPQSRFRVVFREGCSFRAEHLALWILPGEAEEKPTSWGVVITRRAARRATERNRWKRRIREVLRHERERIQRGCEAIFLVERPTPAPTYEELRAQIRQLLEQAGLSKK